MYNIIKDIVYEELVYHSDKILQIEYQCSGIKVFHSIKGFSALELYYTFEYLQPSNIFDLDIAEIVQNFIGDTKDKIEDKSLIGEGRSYRFKFDKISFTRNLIIVRIDFEEVSIDQTTEN